jgi:NAD-dependent oxidoreductase involved in siderophore biosynthesis
MNYTVKSGKKLIYIESAVRRRKVIYVNKKESFQVFYGSLDMFSKTFKRMQL